MYFTQWSHQGYQPGWVHEEVCKRLEKFSRDVVAGKSPRLMLFMPPRHGKSFIASERFPVWHLGHHPDHQIVVAAYGQDLANKFSRKARDLVATDCTEATFPGLKVRGDRKAVEEWETQKGGVYKAVGVGGGLTGSGANILIIDDPVKDAQQARSETYREGVWDWYTSVAETRLMPQSGVLVIMTRWHMDDLAGRLLDKEPERWEVVSFPAVAEHDEAHRKEGEALHPERYPLEKLEPYKDRRWVWSALFQQRPTPDEGGFIKREWFRDYTELPHVLRYRWSWDTAIKPGQENDYSVGQLWAECENGHYLVDLWRGRVEYPELKRQVEALYNKTRASEVLVEDKASGQQLVQDFKRSLLPVIAMMPGKNMPKTKEERVNLVSPLFEAGKVFIPRNKPWVADYIEELAAFPNATHDDQVDATTQALSRAQGKIDAGVILL